MYKLHLIKKYLLKRRIAWVSLLAVMLCTAMVLVVISVMGGWLRMFKSSFRGMNGDVVVDSRSLVGFPYYQEMIEKIEKLPEVKAAVPVINSGGLINIGNRIRDMVQVTGIQIDQIDQVNDFGQSLDRQYEQRKKDLLEEADKPGLTDAQRQKLRTEAEKPTPNFNLLPWVNYQEKAGPKAMNPRNRPGMIVSDILVGIKRGETSPDIMYELPTTLTLVPVIPGEQVRAEDAVTDAFWIVDDSHSRIWQMDYNKVYVPFDVLQRDLHMDANGDQPARASQIQIKAKPGVDLMKLRDQVDEIVAGVNTAHGVDFMYPTKVATWEQLQGKFIDAVEHEVVLTTGLFGVISVVAVFLIFCIFYMIVVEKTKDIGIIKSVGATSWGVAQIFLGYGLAIGLLGAGLGLAAAYGIVRNINALHSWLSRVMGVTIWDPETYQFDKIPNTMDWHTVGWIMLVAVLSALLGALVPAIRAAGMNPVEALRYE
jgi:lipoprotein-releasing system permease protein